MNVASLPHQEPSAAPFAPIVARTQTVRRPVGPVVHDCVMIIAIRDGSAILSSTFGQKPVTAGDMAVLGTHTPCSMEPEGVVTATAIYLDTDYVVDQVVWQHAGLISDRLDAQGFAETICSEPAQILRLDVDKADVLAPWLDELVELSISGRFTDQFFRMQALWFNIAHVTRPLITSRRAPDDVIAQACAVPGVPRHRAFHPLRVEAMQVRELLHSDIAHPWTLAALSAHVHLSPRQLTRLFTQTYGKTPLAYLTMLRVEEMARLLRETTSTISTAGRIVGWTSRSRAAETFREYVGVTPSSYRRVRTIAAAA